MPEGGTGGRNSITAEARVTISSNRADHANSVGTCCKIGTISQIESRNLMGTGPNLRDRQCRNTLNQIHRVTIVRSIHLELNYTCGGTNTRGNLRRHVGWLAKHNRTSRDREGGCCNGRANSLGPHRTRAA